MRRSFIALAQDFGMESVRALLVESLGRERGIAVGSYQQGQILESRPGSKTGLPPH